MTTYTSYNYLESQDIQLLTAKVSSLRLAENRFLKEEAILSSLDFDKRPIRHDSIPPAHRATFGWVLRGSSATENAVHGRFARWLKSGAGAFWITGKPGSGKSTLMKLIAEHLRLKGGPLSDWAQPKRLVVASHYFWSVGTSIQRSEEGLLRTILYDILAQIPEYIPKLCEKRWTELLDPRQPQKPW